MGSQNINDRKEQSTSKRSNEGLRFRHNAQIQVAQNDVKSNSSRNVVEHIIRPQRSNQNWQN